MTVTAGTLPNVTASDADGEVEKKFDLTRIFIYGALSLWTIICLFPIYWTVTTSFKVAKDVQKGAIVPWVGYGVAAGLGGSIVWLWFALAPVGGMGEGEGEFGTLSATPATPVGATAASTTPVTQRSAAAPPGTAPSATPRIDIVFATTPGAAELEAFGREIGATLAAGPSEIGRYSFALDASAAGGIDALLETLRRDPRIRFAGRSYADVSVGGTVTESPGEAR